MDLVIRGQRVVTPTGVTPAAVHVTDGVIVQVADVDDVPDAKVVVEAGDAVISPGLVDTHVHVNEPGRTHWEGFASATRAAAAGGVTTVIDMPLNCIPPTTDLGALERKRAAADGQCHVDVGFWGGAVPGNSADLRELHEEGVFGFKAFLCDSGVDEFASLDSGELKSVLGQLAALEALTIVHAEAPERLRTPTGDLADHDSWLASRPAEAELEAVGEAVAAAAQAGARLHVLHVSSADVLAVTAAAREDGQQLTLETCPHYLCCEAETIPAGTTAFKCAPPIRGHGNRERLWRGLASGEIDFIVSDHSPSPPELKTGDFASAWGGIASLQLGLPLVWTEASRRGHGAAAIAEWMSAAPARLAGLGHKGAIVAGADADLVLWESEASFVVDPRELQHRHAVSPYTGRRLRGLVQRTFLRGREIYHAGRFADRPQGRLLRKGRG